MWEVWCWHSTSKFHSFPVWTFQDFVIQKFLKPLSVQFLILKNTETEDLKADCNYCCCCCRGAGQLLFTRVCLCCEQWDRRSLHSWWLGPAPAPNGSPAVDQGPSAPQIFWIPHPHGHRHPLPCLSTPWTRLSHWSHRLRCLLEFWAEKNHACC